MSCCKHTCDCETKPITYIEYIIDSSGSMGPIKNDAVGGYNAFIEDQKKLKVDDRVKVTLTVFDSTDYVLYESKDLQDVRPLTVSEYFKGGWTALLDAVGRAVTRREKNLRENDRVLVVIMTDGEENMSREYTTPLIKEMIENRSQRNWTFTYAGANHDSWSVARNLGIGQLNTIMFSNASPDLMRSSMKGVSNSASNYRSYTSATGAVKMSASFNTSNLADQALLSVEELAKLNDFDLTTGTVAVPNISITTPTTTTTTK